MTTINGPARTPNAELAGARLRTMPSGRTRPLTRQEVADAANAWLATQPDPLNPQRALHGVLDAKYIGRLENGIHRWPAKRYRDALRHVLGARSDDELGFYNTYPSRAQAAVESRSSDVLGHRTMVAPADGRSDRSVGEPVAAIDWDAYRSAGAAWFGMLPAAVAELPDSGAHRIAVPVRVDMVHVRGLRRCVELFENADHEFGGGFSKDTMGRQLDWACCVARSASMSAGVRQAWLSGTARLGDLVGWASFDSGDQERALRYFVAALQLAGEADDVEQRTHTATSMCRQFAYTDRPDDALHMAALARLSWRELPTLGKAAVCIVEARAYARSRDREAVLRAVGTCDDYFASGRTDADQRTWEYYADEGQILGDAGHGLFDLTAEGSDAAMAARTIERLEAAYATHAPEARRSRALTMTRIASLKARFADPGDACAAAELGVAEAETVWSARVIDDLHRLDRHLHAINDPSVDARVEALHGRIRALVTAG